MQALEKPDTKVIFEALDLLSNRSRGDVKLMGNAPEAEVSGGGFECSQRIERWQKISHRWSISGQLEIDFLRSPQRISALRNPATSITFCTAASPCSRALCSRRTPNR
jgi:hypothetical protein